VNINFRTENQKIAESRMDVINTPYLSTGLHHETVLKPGRDKEQKRKLESSSEQEDAETAGRRKRHAAKTIDASSAPLMPMKRRPFLVEKPTVACETEQTDANDKRPQTTAIGM